MEEPHTMRRVSFVMAMLLVLGLVLSACAAPQAPAP
ncbi:MAG: hypothetical protein HW414_1666, partial [Dehalococcoidia bacterium]|nr:hypothetical protein [Dehalococcoidia bacterium]